MKRILVALLGVSLLLVVSACGGGGPRSVPSNAVAVVGDNTITKAQFDALMEQTKNNYTATNHAFPKAGTVALATLRANATQFLIQAAEYEQEAKKNGITITDKDVSARLEQIKQQFYGSQPGQPQATKAQIEKRYQQALKQQGFTDEEVRTGIRLTLLRERVQAKVTQGIKVSDSDIQSYYDKHKAQYATPAQPESRQVRHILVKSKKKADQIYAQLKAHPNLFAKLAKKDSIDTGSGAAGGVLPGGAIKGRLVKPFENVAFSIKSNVISKPVHTQYGWHIIEALGPIKAATPAKPTPLAQVKEAIRQTLLQNQRNTASQDWQKKTTKDYCKKIAYQTGYAPPPGQDPCKPQSTTAATTTG
jgi:foldase protein PrsA